MPHIDQLLINGFRNLRNLSLKELGKFNILVGRNNSGKTSVLEAVELFCHPLDIRQLISTSRSRDKTFWIPYRRMSILDSIVWMFPMKKEGLKEDNNREEILISGIINDKIAKTRVSFSEVVVIRSDFRNDFSKNTKFTDVDSDEETRALNIVLEYEGPVGLFTHEVVKENYIISDHVNVMHDKEKIPAIAQTKMITPIDHRVVPLSSKSLTNIIKSGDKIDFLKLLKSFDSNIKGIEILSTDGRYPMPYLNHKKLGYTPVSVFGDGLRRVITIASMLLQSRDGILLIDELETAVHVEVLENVFSWLINACNKYNIQLFASTHSIEALDAFIKATNINKPLLKGLVTYRLDNNGYETIAKRFTGDRLYNLRYELGQDVR